LIAKELTVNEILHFDALTDELNKNSKKNSTIEKKTTPYISISYQNEYLANTENIEFLAKLPYVKIPYEGEMITRAFEHDGCDMHIKESGLHHKDIVFCKKVNHKQLNNLSDGKIYVVIVKGKLYIKRLTEKGQLLILQTDKANQTIEILLEEVLEMWEVIGVYSTNLYKPNNLELRILKLEERLIEISKKL
jgi:hypothetical protein